MDWGAISNQLKELYITIFTDLVAMFRAGGVAAWRESEGFSAGFWTGMAFALILGGGSGYVIFLSRRVTAFFEPAKGERPIDVMTSCIGSILILAIIGGITLTVVGAWIRAAIN
jgi:hypothetical protein